MHLRRIAFELGVCCAFVALALHAQSRVPDAVYDEVASDFEQGKLAEAEQTLASALREHPQDARAAGLMGVVLDALKHYSEADKYYTHALQLDPRSAPLLNNLGNHYLAQGDSERANRAYLQVVALDPGHPNANLHLAQMSVSARTGYAALRYLNHMPKQDQVAPAVQVLRAQALALAGQRPAAEQLLREVESRRGDDPRAAFSIGMVYADWRLFPDAERALSRALESQPADFEILYNLGLAATRAGHLDRAQEVFGIALKQRPGDVDCLYNLARVHAEQGQDDQAILFLAEAQHLAPKRPDVLMFLAHTSEKLGFYADTALAYDQYLKLKPDDVVRRERGFALARCAKGQEGIQDLRWYAQKHPRDALGLYELAVVETMHDRDKSVAHLNQAIALDPNLTAARYARAILLYQGGQAAESLDDLNFILRLEPENILALDQLGQAYGALERYQEASDVLSRAVKLAPKDTKVLIHYSRALQRLGRRDDAAKVLVQFQQLSPDENRPHPNSGLFEFLKLPPGEQHAQYMTNLRRVATSSPNDPALQVRWAKALISEGKISEALQTFHQVRALTSDPGILADCGKTLLGTDRYEDAQEFLRAAIAADPGNVGSRLDLATALFHTAGARTSLTELDGVPPQRRDGDYFLLRAQILDALGRNQEAGEALDRGLRAAPTRPDLYFEAALFLIKHQRYSLVMDLLQKAPHILSDSPELMLVQAEAYELHQDHDQAQKVLAQIESRWPEWSQPYLMNGIMLESRLESPQALPLLETAVTLGARDAIAYYYLASAISHATPEDVEGARKAIQEALQLDPNDAYVRSLAGLIAYKRKDYKGALEQLTAALRLWPEMVEAHETLSATYNALGEKEKSIAELKEVLHIKQQDPAASHQAPPFPTTDLLFTVRPPL